jgi:hypothetical protein
MSLEVQLYLVATEQQIVWLPCRVSDDSAIKDLLTVEEVSPVPAKPLPRLNDGWVSKPEMTSNE